MKKWFILILVLASFGCSLCGCGKEATSGSDGEESLASETYKKQLKEEYGDIIPVPEFEIDSAIFSSIGVVINSVPITKDEYEKYVKQVIGYGFSEGSTIVGDLYEAYGNGYHFWSVYTEDSSQFNLNVDD